MKSAEWAAWAQIVAGAGTFVATAVLAWVTWRLKASTDVMAEATNEMAKTTKMQATETARLQLIEVFKSLSDIQTVLTDIQKALIDTMGNEFNFREFYAEFREPLKEAFGRFVQYCPVWMDGEDDEKCVCQVKNVHIEVVRRMLQADSDRDRKKEYLSFISDSRLTIGAVGEHLEKKLDAIPRIRF